MDGYKLIRVRKNGSLGSLFINRRAVLQTGKWLQSESHPTKGYKYRKGWHGTPRPHAPHLTKKGRKWYRIKMRGIQKMTRPASQGGTWYLANEIMILEPSQSVTESLKDVLKNLQDGSSR